MTTGIDPSLYLENYRQTQRKAPNNNLGKDEFLRILMVQLQNQDPLNPMEDKEFIAQMAQFSTLEQITNMSNNFAKFMEFQKSNVLASYVNWIGKDVDWEIIIANYDDDGNELEPTIETGSGIIESVQVGTDGIVEFHMDDGKVVYQDEIKTVRNEHNNEYETQLSLASQMVGMMVSWLNEDDEQIDFSIISSVHMKNGKVLYELNDGTLIKGEQLIKIAHNPINENTGTEPTDNQGEPEEEIPEIPDDENQDSNVNTEADESTDDNASS